MSLASEPVQASVRLPAAQARRLVASSTTLLGAAVPLALVAFASDRHRAVHGYFVGVLFVVTIGVGALFFIALHHLTHARWSVAARRHMEWITGVLPWSALLCIPVVVFARDVFPALNPAIAARLGHKAAYLSQTSLFLRSAVVVAAWAALSQWFRKLSRVYDEHANDVARSRMRRWSGPAMLVLGITLTSASFDWLMSLSPDWCSSLFGIYVFAGAVTSSLATLAVITVHLQGSGALRAVSGVVHRHDIGKLLFGFTLFWVYIAFSQYLLVWYANLPRETRFYEMRWAGEWRGVTCLLGILHFVVPFVALLARRTKRSPFILNWVAITMLAAHAVDLYWLVFPAAGFAPSVTDLAAAAVAPCALLGVIATCMSNEPLYPRYDPDLVGAVGLSLSEEASE